MDTGDPGTASADVAVRGVVSPDDMTLPSGRPLPSRTRARTQVGETARTVRVRAREGGPASAAGRPAEGREDLSRPVGDDRLHAQPHAQVDVLGRVDGPHVHRMALAVAALDVARVLPDDLDAGA